MRLRRDERGQSVQIGAVLLFAVLVVAFAGYQAGVVPQQNQRVEFDHSRVVQEDLRDLRNAVLASRGGGSTRPTTVTLGTRYPPRAVALNGPDPSGVLRTRGTGDADAFLAVDNATATGEPGDAWDGTERTFDTGRITYEPRYNHYEEPPVTTYENTLLYDDFGGEAILLANQSFVDGRTVDLVAVNGSLYRTGSDATTVDVDPVSASSESTLVSAASPAEPVTIRFQSRHSPARWRSILSDQPHVASVTASARNGTADRWGIAVALDADEQYRLRLTKVGVGTRVAGEGPHYLDVGEDDGASVSSGAERRVSFVVRDRFDNPVSGVVVNASVGGSDAGTLVEDSATSDEDGRATFTYRTSDATATGTHEINGTLNESGELQQRPFDARTLANATLTVSVGTGGGDGSGGGSSGAYALSWKAPDATSGNGGAALSDCSTDACTWDVGGSSDATLDLNATTTPAFEGVGVEFAVNDSAVGTLSSGSGTTGSSGALRNELTAQGNGTVNVLASANDDSDVVAVEVVNYGAGGPTLLVRIEDLSHQNEGTSTYLASYEYLNPPAEFDSVRATFENQNRNWATANLQDPAARGTFEYGQSAPGDPYDITVEALDGSGNRIDAVTRSDDSADGRNPSGNDALGDGNSPSFASYEIVDQSGGGNGVQYGITYDVQGTGFAEVRAELISLESGAGGSDSATYTSTSVDGETLSTYGYDAGAPNEFKVVLLAVDDDGVVTDSASWSEPADGTGSTSG